MPKNFAAGPGTTRKRMPMPNSARPVSTPRITTVRRPRPVMGSPLREVVGAEHQGIEIGAEVAVDRLLRPRHDRLLVVEARVEQHWNAGEPPERLDHRPVARVGGTV